MEIAYGQIIKIVIGLLVLVAVVIGVTLGFRNYIIPYFTEIGPSGDTRDFETPYYQELIADENLVGFIPDVRENKKYIQIETDGELVRTKYYFWKGDRKEIYFDDDSFWRRDVKVGEVDDNGIVEIFEEYGDERLNVIEGGELIIKSIYKLNE